MPPFGVAGYGTASTVRPGRVRAYNPRIPGRESESPAPMSRDQNAVILDRAAIEREVDRVVAAVAERGRPIRVLGSIGVVLHCPDARSLIPSFERTYADIDFVAYKRDARDVAAAISGLGYIEDRQVFIFSEGRRAIFEHPFAQIHLDVFFDRLEFCHVIPMAGRLETDSPTIPLAELLLSKLQIVKLNGEVVGRLRSAAFGYTVGRTVGTVYLPAS